MSPSQCTVIVITSGSTNKECRALKFPANTDGNTKTPSWNFSKVET